jgi:protoporphyrinogen oxidase
MERVGGRTNTVKINGFNFDLGAEFIGQTQIHIIELAQECGNVLKDTFH